MEGIPQLIFLPCLHSSIHLSIHSSICASIRASIYPSMNERSRYGPSCLYLYAGSWTRISLGRIVWGWGSFFSYLQPESCHQSSSLWEETVANSSLRYWGQTPAPSVVPVTGSVPSRRWAVVWLSAPLRTARLMTDVCYFPVGHSSQTVLWQWCGHLGVWQGEDTPVFPASSLLIPHIRSPSFRERRPEPLITGNRNILDTVNRNQMELALLSCAVGDYARDCSFVVCALGLSFLPSDFWEKEGHSVVPYSGQAQRTPCYKSCDYLYSAYGEAS